MRANSGQGGVRGGSTAALGRILSLCFLILVGGLPGPGHDAFPAAQAGTMVLANDAIALETRQSGAEERLASCHVLGACVYFANPHATLPVPAATSGERRIQDRLHSASRPDEGPFRPPRLPAHA